MFKMRKHIILNKKNMIIFDGKKQFEGSYTTQIIETKVAEEVLKRNT